MLPHPLADVNGFYSSYMTGRPGDCLPLFPSAARLIRIAKGAEQVNPKISTKTLFIYTVRSLAFVQDLAIRFPVTWNGDCIVCNESSVREDRLRRIFRIANVLSISRPGPGRYGVPPALRLMISCIEIRRYFASASLKIASGGAMRCRYQSKTVGVIAIIFYPLCSPVGFSLSYA